MVLYVDDVLLYRGIHSPQEYHTLQSEVDQMFDWSERNCKQMVISRKQKPLPHSHLKLGYNIFEPRVCILFI